MNDFPRPVSKAPIDKLMMPFRVFASRQTSGSIVLVIMTLIALIWANSPWAAWYHELWHVEMSITIGSHKLTEPLILWINDGLMAMFFFVVGLEIKREMLAGELSNPRQAILPIFAAVGGMVVPAIVYLLFNYDEPTIHGWGVPMATDIAFALGILYLLGDRVPSWLKIFLTALAIVDDLGAVLVIAFFYTSGISFLGISLGAIFLFILIAGNFLGIRSRFFYAVFGIGGVWLAFLFSGVHATIAGILTAFTIPTKTKIDSTEFLKTMNTASSEFEEIENNTKDTNLNPQRLSVLLKVKMAYDLASTPLQKLEKQLHPWVVFFILPLFALSNAGISIKGDFFQQLQSPVALGVIFGLLIGKPLGIFSFIWLAIKFNFAKFPPNIGYRDIAAVSIFGGIGFTMSLFIGTLAFDDSLVITTAKAGILAGSILSAMVGWLVFRAVRTA